MAVRILLLLFTVTFAAQLGLGLVSPLLPIYAQDLGASGIWLGIIFAFFSFARFIAMPIVGRYSDEYGRRRFIVYGLAIYTVVSLLYILANSPETLSVIRFAHGISSAMVVPVAMAYVGDISPRGREGRYMGMFYVSMSLGVGFGPLMGGVITDSLGFDYAFVATGMLALANLVFVIAILPESTATRKAIPRVPYRTVLADRPVQAILAYRLVNSLGQGMVLSFLPIYAMVQRGLPLTMVGLVLSSRWLTNSIFNIPFGLLSDRYNRTLLAVIGGVVFATALVAMPIASDGTQLLAINMLGAVGSSLAMASTSAITTTLGRGLGMGTLMGLINAGHALGMTIGPLMAGIIFDTIGLNELFYVGGMCSAIGILTFVVLMYRSRGDARL